ncbi:hypothetical protein JW707_01030 [Candidatus Woesearchaeota archaeon]|nr:hypothetical protein [Candidatus Woesearchaeota archaeon]
MVKNYIKEKYSEFIEGFKSLDRTLLFVVVYNLVFYISVVISYSKMLDIMYDMSQPLMAIAASTLSESVQILDSQIATFKMFYFSMIGYAALFLIILYLIYSLTNLFMWSAITKTKLRKSSRNFILKFFGLNLAWLVAWAVLVFILLLSLRTETVPFWFVAAILIYAHTTTIAYIAYFKRKKICVSIKSAFNTGFAKLHKFLIPYVFALIVFIIINAVFTPIGNMLYKGVNTIFLIAFLFYSAWLRIYVYSFAKKLV